MKKFIALTTVVLTFVLNNSGNSLRMLEYDDNAVPPVHHFHISYPTDTPHLQALNRGASTQVRFFEGLDLAHQAKTQHGQNIIFYFWQEPNALGSGQTHQNATNLFIEEVNRVNPLPLPNFVINILANPR